MSDPLTDLANAMIRRDNCLAVLVTSPGLIVKCEKYPTYVGWATIENVDEEWHGEMLFMDDVVTFESDKVTELSEQMALSLDDYKEMGGTQ